MFQARGSLLAALARVLLLIAVSARAHQVNKRQILLPDLTAGCIAAYFDLDGAERDCLNGLGESISINGGTIVLELTPSQLDLACGPSGCQRALVKLIEACESEIRNGLQLPDVVNIDSLLSLLCVKDQNDTYCFYQLERPLLENDHDPLLLCNLRSSQQQCSDNCAAALSPFSSTCCLVTYLYLVAGNSAQRQIASSSIWESCSLTPPSLCPGVNLTAGTSPVAGGGDGNSSSNSDAGIIIGAVIGGLIVVLLFAILLIQLVYLVYRYRIKSYTVSGATAYHHDNMKVTLTDHEHTETNGAM